MRIATKRLKRHKDKSYLRSSCILSLFVAIITMQLNSENLRTLADVAIKAAQKAGKLISETRPTAIQHKESGKNLASQVLTEVDLKSQEIILEILKPTLEEFDLALLTEESPDDGSRLEKDYNKIADMHRLTNQLIK